jgi:hypothetical protein
MKHLTKALILILTGILLIGTIGCETVAPPAREETVSADTVSMQQTAAPTPEATPEEIVIAAADTPELPTLPPTPSPSPTPEPTPVPPPTEIPFSYYAPTVNMSFEELVGSLPDFDESNPYSDATFRYPAAYPPPDTYRIIVDVYWQVVMVYTKDENGEYTVPVRYMLCSTGNGAKYSETRLGTFKMRETKIRFGQFQVSKEWAQYWSLIVSKTYFHSVLYNKKRELNSVQEAAYKALGSKASHGCIRLTVPDARWIFYNICYGTECEIRKGSKDDSETRAIREQLHLAEWKDGVMLSVGTTPYTDNWTIDEVETDPQYPYIHATQKPIKNK